VKGIKKIIEMIMIIIIMTDDSML